MRQTLPLDQRPRPRTSARERREANSTRAPQFRHRIATHVFYCSDCRRSLRHFGSKQFLTCIPSFDSFHRARMCSPGAHARSNAIALTAMQSSIHGLFVSFSLPHQSSIWLTFFVRELPFPFNQQRHDVIVRISGGRSQYGRSAICGRRKPIGLVGNGPRPVASLGLPSIHAARRLCLARGQAG